MSISPIYDWEESSPPGTESHEGTLADYTLGDCLGKGAFGSVYRALNWGTGETVAVKQIRLTDLPKSELRVIMLEIDLLKNLNHPNIVQYHGFVKSTDSLYIILEFCENGSLHNICKNFGKFPENLVGLYMTQVLHGLLYLHDQGVIHRDIKGANILTTKEGLIKLADFGVATRATGLNDSSVVGTPYWMAPEVIELVGATTASDIWSVGCTVIELLEGKPPYHDLAPMPALFRIVNDDHPPLPDGASPAVRDFLMQCFQKDPNLRVTARKLLKHPWIESSKRPSSRVRSSTTTQYDDAVKSVQQWNEALRTPNDHPGRPLSESGPANDVLDRRRQGETKSTVLNKPIPDLFASLQDSTEDNWDDDFSSNISDNTFELSHLKPHDLFAGQMSSENLKLLASPKKHALQSIGKSISKYTRHQEGKDPFDEDEEEDDAMRTIRPWSAAPSIANTPRASSSPIHSASGIKYLQNGKDLAFLPSKQILPAPPEDLASKRNSATRSNSSNFLLAPIADTQFLFATTSLEVVPTQASDSSFEIRQFAESDEEDDYSDVFGDSDIEDDFVSEAADDGTLILNTRHLNSPWNGDNDQVDEEDPFAALEEGLEEMDLDANIARDKFARLCAQVEELVVSLKAGQNENSLYEIASQLSDVLVESPDMKDTIVAAHGILPILEILETCRNREVVFKLLCIINAIVCDDVEIQENLCFVGGIPVITQFASKKYAQDLRLEAANFVQQICQTSILTLQMFISCGGLNVLVEFVEEDYITQRELVLIGIDGIWSVFGLQGSTPKNDFCRLLCRNSVLHPLSVALTNILDEGEAESLGTCCQRIINIFLIFSQAENQVKETIADRFVMKRILKDIKRLKPAFQIILLKFIKNLSMLSTTLDSLQNANAIEVLIDMLAENSSQLQFKEISNQILSVMFNLCRHSKPRQEEAAMNGIIPLLQKIVRTERPLKEFALPILCDMAHSGKIGRKYLWQNDGLNFFLSLLSDPYWQVAALDAIFIWLQDETAKVEDRLIEPGAVLALITCFTTSSSNSFENLLEPLQKLLRLSLPVAEAIGQSQFFARILQKLTHHKAVVRVNLLRILRSICDASTGRKNLIRNNGLYPMISWLAETDSAVLVRNMAADLIKYSVDERSESNYRHVAGNDIPATLKPGSLPPNRKKDLDQASMQRGNSPMKARKPASRSRFTSKTLPEEISASANNNARPSSKIRYRPQRT